MAEARPGGITALSIFFAASSLISLVASMSMASPGGFLEPLWRLNPRARTAFSGFEGWAVLLLGTVSFACGLAAAGLWRVRRWGYWTAVAFLAVYLLGDVAIVALGVEWRAAFGIPVVLALLAYLWGRRVRNLFGIGAGREYRAA